MPRRKQDETPLLARTIAQITGDDYGEARAREFLANLKYAIDQKWPVAMAVKAAVKKAQGRKKVQVQGATTMASTVQAQAAPTPMPSPSKTNAGTAGRAVAGPMAGGVVEDPYEPSPAS